MTRPHLLAVALLLTACGSGSTPVARTPPPSPAAAAPGTLSVVARDYSFGGFEGYSPKVGDTLTVSMRNSGKRPHDLEVRSPDGNDLGGVPTVDEGESATGSVALEAAGVYSYLCTIGAHADLGMKGTFTVA